MVHKAHNYRGVQDVELGLLAHVARHQPDVLADVMERMAKAESFQAGIEFMVSP